MKGTCSGLLAPLSWQQHPTRLQLYGQLPPIMKTIQVRRTRHAGHCWRSRNELIRDVLLWIPTHGRAKAGRPARTYIQQLCEDTGCCPEDLPRAMNDREEWRERVRDIRVTSAIWWWWWCSWKILPINPNEKYFYYMNLSFFFSLQLRNYIKISNPTPVKELKYFYEFERWVTEKFFRLIFKKAAKFYYGFLFTLWRFYDERN